MVVFFLSLLASPALAEEGRRLSDDEAERQWRIAAKEIERQLDGPNSFTVRYAMSYPLDSSRRRHMQVDAVTHGGLMLNTEKFKGRSYFRSVTWVDGSAERQKNEYAVLGNGEATQHRIGGKIIRDGKGRRVNCSMPHTAAEYYTLEFLIRYVPKPTLLSAHELDDGVLRFEFLNAIGNCRTVIFSQPMLGYMPHRIETHINEHSKGEEFTLVKVTEANYEWLPGAGRRYIYPVSGQVTSFNAGKPQVDYVWSVVKESSVFEEEMFVLHEDDAPEADRLEPHVREAPESYGETTPIVEPETVDATPDTGVAGARKAPPNWQKIRGDTGVIWWQWSAIVGGGAMLVVAFVLYRRK